MQNPPIPQFWFVWKMLHVKYTLSPASKVCSINNNHKLKHYFCQIIFTKDILGRIFPKLYKNFTKHRLKEELKWLTKKQNPPIPQICFVWKMLRVKAILSHTNKVCSINHNLELKNNFNKVFLPKSF